MVKNDHNSVYVVVEWSPILRVCKRLFLCNFFPCPRNAWPPLQELIVTGLENTEEPKAIEIAKNLVHKWLYNVYESYDDSGQKMFEKYDVQRVRHF